MKRTILILALSTSPTVMAVAGETDNPVVAADDAFGMTLGTETIGIYGPALVRGFNPQAAGNVRLDGLYFDQQAPLSNRVIEGSTIHVGISNTGYIFPAPTGIVDYTLRSGRGSSPAATLMAYAGPFDSTAVYLDASLPLLEQQIMVPIGGGAELQATAPGYTSRVYSFGTVPKWTPNEKITVRALLDWQQVSHERKEPFVFPSGDFIPPPIGGGYWGQNWSETRATMLNFGAMLGAHLSEHWSMSAGIFRSISDSPVSYSDLYFNAQPSGSADHLVVGYPNQYAASTSGEVRLMRHTSVGAWYHDVIVTMRGRDVRDIYGGSDVVDLGTISLGDTQQFPEPAFRYSARDTDHGDLSATGIIYRIQLPNKVDSSIGLQRYDYRKSDALADGPQFRLSESTWRGYASLTYSLTEQVTAYTGYTQGLEDSGVAPSNAENRGAVLPATETWQVDAGLRYLMADRVKWLLGIFEINEPYFSIDQSNVDRELGAQQARGLEFSVSGQICPGLSIVGGAMITHVKVIGSDLTALGISSVAFGQSHNQFVLNADYRPEFWPALSLDFGFNRTGVTPASQDGTLGIPPFNIINVGGRYRFGILGHSASLRMQVSNLTNVYTWNVNSTPGFYRLPPRGFLAYLTVGV